MAIGDIGDHARLGSTDRFPAYAESALKVEVDEGSGRIELRLRGSADMASLHVIDANVRQIHTKARERRASVELDIRELLFMNSSCLKCLVWWLTSLNDLPIFDRYRLRIFTNTNLQWQRRSLQALTAFAPGLVTIEG